MQHRSFTNGARLVAAVAILGALAGLLGHSIARAEPAAQGAELLANAGFEPFITPDGKYDYPIFETPEGGGHVAEFWAPWWYNDEGPTYSVPEFDIAPVYRDPYRVHGGLAAQQIFRPSVYWKAGVFQRVKVPNNAQLRFTIWGHAWATFCVFDPETQTHDCNPRDSNHGGANPTTMRIGIDPYGGADWASGSIVWSQDYNIHDNFEQLVVNAQARGEYVTVYTYTTFEWPAVINNVYWDDASLVVSTGSSPTPVPPPGTPPGEPTGQVLEAKTVVNVRTGPSTSYAVIGQIRPGTKYNVIGQSGLWYNIDYKGKSGWVYGPLTTVTSGTVPDIPPGQGVEANVTLNVRAGPGTNYVVIGRIYPGTVYLILSKSGNWYQIDYNGTPGWVSASYVTVR